MLSNSEIFKTTLTILLLLFWGFSFTQFYACVQFKDTHIKLVDKRVVVCLCSSHFYLQINNFHLLADFFVYNTISLNNIDILEHLNVFTVHTLLISQ